MCLVSRVRNRRHERRVPGVPVAMCEGGQARRLAVVVAEYSQAEDRYGEVCCGCESSGCLESLSRRAKADTTLTREGNGHGGFESEGHVGNA